MKFRPKISLIVLRAVQNCYPKQIFFYRETEFEKSDRFLKIYHSKLVSISAENVEDRILGLSETFR